MVVQFSFTYCHARSDESLVELLEETAQITLTES
jgi:hypothetical protein